LAQDVRHEGGLAAPSPSCRRCWLGRAVLLVSWLMRFSIWPSPVRPWSDVVAVTQHAEASGWDGVYFADHFMPNDFAGATPLDGPTLECWSVLGALAAATSRVRLGSLVCGNTYRHPAVLANIAASVDNISNGRVVLGLGAGWQENEHQAYGIDLYDTRTRLDRFAEACAIVRSMLDNERTTFHGKHYTITDAPNQPAPVQTPLPLLIGGGGEKRTLRIAAQYAQEWNVWGTAELVAQKSAVLAQHCESLGRDPSTIARSTQGLMYLSEDESWLAGKRTQDTGRPMLVGTPDEVTDIVAGYRDAGVDELIVPDWNMGPVSRVNDTLDLFIERVAPAFR
jgi:F420-dependent oxidoreductase-like protein